MKSAITTESECLTCGQPVDAESVECPICMGTRFRTRFRCTRCDELLDEETCPKCAPPAPNDAEARTSLVPHPPPTPARKREPRRSATEGRHGKWVAYLLVFIVAHLIVLAANNGWRDSRGNSTAAGEVIPFLWAVAGFVLGWSYGRRRDWSPAAATAPFWMGFAGLGLGFGYAALCASWSPLIATVAMVFFLRFLNRQVVPFLPWDDRDVWPR